ncbi:amidase signature enzyme [Karstenula rhodostoma CBS 690.94]|uniref:Amidase signature enzyme n=1 Tax=Karstenula rhodostoma CBS 690.94 TaxID=1392251 RepID=A0A9P4PD38_9PLEO|nr:amidase signature enzyme [Karstenula rhodostoma CBS 690.94]
MSPPPEHDFDVLTTTADELQLLLRSRRIDSVQIVKRYLEQIGKYNDKLRAVICVSPGVEAVARKLDGERARGRERGLLHGIPIIVKDAFNTKQSMGMSTTVGSTALLGSKVEKNARLVDALIDQGLIILGKANLTVSFMPPVLVELALNPSTQEFCGLKGVGGWSAVGGLCQSPYMAGGFIPGSKRRDESAPGGSSTGSAVGVAAGFAPLSLGTETSGSLTTPASRAALYALKLTPGAVSMEGAPSLVKAIQQTWDGISVGFVDIELWRLPPEARGDVPGYNEQSARDYSHAIELLRKSGANVVHPVYITPPEEWGVEDRTNVSDLMDDILHSQVRAGCEYYLGTLHDNELKTLQDIIDYNSSHSDKEFHEVFCPNQNGLIKAQSAHMSPEETVKNLEICKKWSATEGVDKVIAEHGVDVIVAPADSFFAGVGVGARYPLASIPFGYVDSSGRPYGLHVIAKANEEDKIIKFMGMWEKTVALRRVPDVSAL